MKGRFLLILCCALLAGTVTGCSDSDDKKASRDIAAESDGSIVFEASTMDGETLSSAIFKNSRLTMINVWATYCNPCLNEMPELGELASEYDSADFQLLGIISDVTEEAPPDMLELADSLIKETKADYPHLILNESLYYAFLSDVTAVPTTFFFNEDGEIVDTVIGAMDKADWEEKIDELLEKF